MSDPSSSAPRNNKFAAMAARQKQAATATTATTPATSQLSSPATTPTTSENESTTKSETPVNTLKVVPKRDKFAALAAHAPVLTHSSDLDTPMSTTSAPDTSMQAATVTTAPTATTMHIDKDAEEEREAELEKRVNQRENVWKDLELAEVTVIRLLRTAQQTAEALQNINNNNNNSNNKSLSNQVAALSQEYRQHLTHLHDLLLPHANLVQAYQVPKHVHKLYQARVEQRLAVEKQELLQEWKDLEQQNTNQSSNLNTDNSIGDKRKRDD